jgi:transcriptional regulator of nitric oxide reductase
MEIISGVTVTVMVIDDSIVRSGIRVARLLGLGGLAPPTDPTGPRFELDPDAVAATGWLALVGDGTVRRLSLDVGQVNEAFERHDDPRAAERPLPRPAAADPGLDAEAERAAQMALVQSPMIGFSWQAFMLAPLTFILWWAGAYCGWLCPFDPLQELTNQATRRCGCRSGGCPGRCTNGCGR